MKVVLSPVYLIILEQINYTCFLCVIDDESCPIITSDQCEARLVSVLCAHLQKNQKELPQFCNSLIEEYIKK